MILGRTAVRTSVEVTRRLFVEKDSVCHVLIFLFDFVILCRAHPIVLKPNGKKMEVALGGLLHYMNAAMESCLDTCYSKVV